MGTFSITYWPPSATATPSIMSVVANEFAFTETHVVFLDDKHAVILAVPLTLQPIVRYAGAAA